jgi:hypothetical protein
VHHASLPGSFWKELGRVLAHLSLLEIQFGAIEGRANQHRAASPILRSLTIVAMMQAADLRERNNVIACEG